MEDEIKPSRKRIKKNIAALNSLIEKEENSMTKRKFVLKPLIIAAVITVSSMLLLITVNASMKGAVVKFLMGGEEIEGAYFDYVDNKGFRHVSFEATLPIYEENFATIYDVDAPREEACRLITDDTDPEFMDKLRQYKDAQGKAREDVKAMWAEIYAWNGRNMHEDNSDMRDEAKREAEEAGIIDPANEPKLPEPEDFGLVFKDSELCLFRLGYVSKDNGFYTYDGSIGGEFMHMGAAENHPSGVGDDDHPNECTYDWDNEIKTYRESFFYYVGK